MHDAINVSKTSAATDVWPNMPRKVCGSDVSYSAIGGKENKIGGCPQINYLSITYTLVRYEQRKRSYNKKKISFHNCVFRCELNFTLQSSGKHEVNALHKSYWLLYKSQFLHNRTTHK